MYTVMPYQDPGEALLKFGMLWLRQPCRNCIQLRWTLWLTCCC